MRRFSRGFVRRFFCGFVRRFFRRSLRRFAALPRRSCGCLRAFLGRLARLFGRGRPLRGVLRSLRRMPRRRIRSGAVRRRRDVRGEVEGVSVGDGVVHLDHAAALRVEGEALEVHVQHRREVQEARPLLRVLFPVRLRVVLIVPREVLLLHVALEALLQRAAPAHVQLHVVEAVRLARRVGHAQALDVRLHLPGEERLQGALRTVPLHLELQRVAEHARELLHVLLLQGLVPLPAERVRQLGRAHRLPPAGQPVEHALQGQGDARRRRLRGGVEGAVRGRADAVDHVPQPRKVVPHLQQRVHVARRALVAHADVRRPPRLRGRLLGGVAPTRGPRRAPADRGLQLHLLRPQAVAHAPRREAQERLEEQRARRADAAPLPLAGDAAREAALVQRHLRVELEVTGGAAPLARQQQAADALPVLPREDDAERLAADPHRAAFELEVRGNVRELDLPRPVPHVQRAV